MYERIIDKEKHIGALLHKCIADTNYRALIITDTARDCDDLIWYIYKNVFEFESPYETIANKIRGMRPGSIDFVNDSTIRLIPCTMIYTSLGETFNCVLNLSSYVIDDKVNTSIRASKEQKTNSEDDASDALDSFLSEFTIKPDVKED